MVLPCFTQTKDPMSPKKKHPIKNEKHPKLFNFSQLSRLRCWHQEEVIAGPIPLGLFLNWLLPMIIPMKSNTIPVSAAKHKTWFSKYQDLAINSLNNDIDMYFSIITYKYYNSLQCKCAIMWDGKQTIASQSPYLAMNSSSLGTGQKLA